MCRKGEQIKKMFLGNAAVSKLVPDSVYKDRLDKSVADSKNNVKAAEDALKSLPENNKTRIKRLMGLEVLKSGIEAVEQEGQGDPVKAWKKIEGLRERASNWAKAAEEDAKAVKSQLKEVDEAVGALRAEIAQMRLNRRDVQNDAAASRLAKSIGELDVRINKTLNEAPEDPERALSVFDDLAREASLLLSGTDTAKGSTPTGQRKASRQTTDAVLGALGEATKGKENNRLGEMLKEADSEPDQNGHTLKGQIKSVLEVFDDRFAKSEGTPEAERDNTAMRVAAIASTMALRLVKQQDINDPLLKPLVARKIVQEYGEELAKAIASKKVDSTDAKALEAEKKKAENALKLAEALVGEDPVTKVFTGKITGPHAVESIRNQAKAAGLPSSRMFSMQRQQLEMRVGSMSKAEVDKGRVAADVTLRRNDEGELINEMKEKVDDPRKAEETQSFVLHDLYGELSPEQIEGLVEYQEEKMAHNLGNRKTSTAWRTADQGGGLDYKPTGKQEHRVEDGDTVAGLAETYYGDDEGIGEIAKLNKYVFWTEQVSQDEANQDAKGSLRGKVPTREQRKQAKIEDFLPDKLLPKGAVLTISGKSGVLDQLAEYLEDDIEIEDTDDKEEDADKASRASLDESKDDSDKTTTGQKKPKITPQALGEAAKRLLPPVRPEVIRRIAELKAMVDSLSDEARKTSKSLSQYTELTDKVREYRDLAKDLATKLEDPSTADIQSTEEYARFQKLRLELSDPNYIQAPGLGQDHSLGGTLKDSRAEKRPEALKAAEERNKEIKELNERIKKNEVSLEAMKGKGETDTSVYKSMKAFIEKDKKTRESLIEQQEKARDAERSEGREGAMNERQYAHLKMLERWDEKEKERFQAEKGKTVQEFVTEKLAAILKCDESAAKDALKRAFDNILSVPLTITFKAENLFSDSKRNEPAHGSVYTSEVVYSRKEVDLEKLVGRGDKATGKAAITGGDKTQVKKVKDEDGNEVEEEADANWIATRGKNYMRWRTDKDDREAHGDRLTYKDQQLFGAANPNWEKTHGGTDNDKADKKVGTNYYGNAHFLLKDSVRSRIAYVVRGAGISEGGGKTSFQRKDFLMLFHDMIMGGQSNNTYLKALLNIGKGDYQKTSNAWEFHLYGGFDIRRDAAAIYIADVVDKEAQKRIKKYAEKHGINVVADKPKGVEAENKGQVVALEV